VENKMIRTVENGKAKEMKLDEVIAAVNPKNIVKMELVADKNGDSMVSVWVNKDGELQFYNFSACKGYQIHSINEFLRSLDLDLDIDIEFQTYEQYAMLLDQCMDLLTLGKVENKMNEKMMSAIFEECVESMNYINLPSLDEAKDGVEAFLKKLNIDIKIINELESCFGAVEADAERQGFYNGFKAAYNFFKSLQD